MTLKGNIVLSLCIFSHADEIELDKTTLDLLIKLIHEKIKMADEVYVIDPGKYIGISTYYEIEYAKALNKPIKYYSQEYYIKERER